MHQQTIGYIMSKWIVKLQKLQDLHHSSPEKLATMLGITTRTLSDFMKPVEEGGREPTKPIQLLIDHLLGESGGSKPGLNLVLIHSDFRIREGFSAVDSIDFIIDLNVETPRNIESALSMKSEPFRNEYHYIGAHKSRSNQIVDMSEILGKKKIMPQFLVAEIGVDLDKALDMYFTATAMWLVSQALSQELAHVTIAANINNFWVLAKEIREFANVGVTFVLQHEQEVSDGIIETLEEYKISIISPLGRLEGEVSAIHPNGSFGHITNPMGKQMFFSWNHMKRGLNGLPELEIHHLKVGDKVYFTIGVNNKGPCATDVAIVKRGGEAEVELNAIISTLNKELTPEEQDLLNTKIADVVGVCADADGRALLADVGSRIKLMHPDASKILYDKGYKLSDFVKKQYEKYEYEPRGGGAKSAACIRLNPMPDGALLLRS
jgi:cold shock CspA family protein